MKKRLLIPKILFLLIHLFVAVNTYAQSGSLKSEWQVYSDDKGHYLGLKKKQFKLIRLEAHGSRPQIMKVIPYEKMKHIVFIHYFAGESGTTEAVKQFHVVVFNTKTQQFLGKAPYRYISATPGLTQPKWDYKEDHIAVKTPYQGEIIIPFQ